MSRGSAHVPVFDIRGLAQNHKVKLLSDEEVLFPRVKAARQQGDKFNTVLRSASGTDSTACSIKGRKGAISTIPVTFSTGNPNSSTVQSMPVKTTGVRVPARWGAIRYLAASSSEVRTISASSARMIDKASTAACTLDSSDSTRVDRRCLPAQSPRSRAPPIQRMLWGQVPVKHCFLGVISRSSECVDCLNSVVDCRVDRSGRGVTVDYSAICVPSG